MNNGTCRFLLTDNDNFCAFLTMPTTNAKYAMLCNNEWQGQKIIMGDVGCKIVFSGDDCERKIAQSIMRKIGNPVVFEMDFGPDLNVEVQVDNGSYILNHLIPHKAEFL